ncbi:MAG: cytidylate kinase family protein [Candidatus Rokuibacteriota bacterium]
MGIVAISENLGSQGDEIGREVARALGWRFADREIIARAAEQYGEGVSELHHVIEERPTLWERFTASKRHYLSYVEATIFEMAAHGHAVLVGHGAAVLLRGVPHALRVRVNAPEPVRAERVRQAQGLVESAARNVVRETDGERASRIRFLYHVDVDDPLLYDLTLNTDRLTVTDGVRLVREALTAERLHTRETGLGVVRDLSLAAQAKARLLRDERTRSLHLSVTAAGGRVTVAGVVDLETRHAAALEVVRGVPDVGEVVDEMVVSQISRSYVRT